MENDKNRLLDLRKKILAKCDEDVAAIDRILLLTQQAEVGAELNGVKDSISKSAITVPKRGQLMREVRKIISRQKSEFSLAEIEVSIKAEYPLLSFEKTALTTALWQLEKRGEIKPVSTARGKRKWIKA